MQGTIRKTLFIIISIIVLLTLKTEAQRDEVFTGETLSYIEELKIFMTNLPEQYEEVLKSFITAWEEDSLFDETEQQNIVKISQLMVERKARPYPHFYKLLSCMLAFEERNKIPENYTNWIIGFTDLLEKRKTKISWTLNSTS